MYYSRKINAQRIVDGNKKIKSPYLKGFQGFKSYFCIEYGHLTLI